MKVTDTVTDTVGQPSARPTADAKGAKLPYVIVIVIVVVAAGAYWLWRAKWETYHFASVDAGVLYRDGNRGLREFRHAIERGKVKTVVMLVDDDEISDDRKLEFGQELTWCKFNGVRVERIRVPLGGWPTRQEVAEFLAIVSDKNKQPVLVHCAQGVRRTGMMVAAYQRKVLGWDAAKCKAEILTFGHSQRTVGDVQRFIDGYDPVTGKVPEGLPVGKE
jgi:protein-tyrosine phosphatase